MTPREQAASEGRTTYSTGLPCVKGHRSPRYVCNGQCKQCAANAISRYRNKNRHRYMDNVHSCNQLSVHNDDYDTVVAIVESLNIARYGQSTPKRILRTQVRTAVTSEQIQADRKSKFGRYA